MHNNYVNAIMKSVHDVVNVCELLLLPTQPEKLNLQKCIKVKKNHMCKSLACLKRLPEPLLLKTH